MSSSPLFPLSDRSKGRSSPRKNSSSLNVEALEDRSIPSCTTISGFVYHDVNNNGLFDQGEQPIANSTIELRNAAGAVIATTTSDATGAYKFEADDTLDQTPQTLTKTVEFPLTQTNFDLSGLLDKFDPALGELKEVQISHAGSITSEIKVENTSLPSGSPISGTVSGNLTLVAPGVNNRLTISEYAGSITAQAFDGNIDFTGASGSSFGKKTADGANTITLTGPDIQAYIGTGKVTVTEKAVATSRADGGGNLVANIESKASAKITVKYKFVPNNCIQAGDYTIVQKQQPPGFIDGKESKNGTVLNTPPGTDTITVTVPDNAQDVVLPNNNFGELKAAKVSGHVFFDSNNNGTRDPGEAPIPGTKVDLAGFDEVGPVQRSATTDASGFYEFGDLRPGSYSLSETQPAGFTDGKDHLGSQGGTAQNDQFLNISLDAGEEGTDYDFGELKPAGLSGHVFHDRNDNGVRDPGEEGIAGAKVTLTGTQDEGGTVNVIDTTDAGGNYSFDNLKAGNYTLTETQPAGYEDGKDRAGSLGGTAGNDVISSILLGMGQAGINYDFGEKQRQSGDVGIAKTASASVSTINDFLTYTLTITNNGPHTARAVTVTDVLPPGVIYQGTVAPPDWTVSHANGVITATIPAMATGVVVPIKVTVQVPGQAATITNRSEVTTETPDDNPNNNKSNVTTTVVENPGTPRTRDVFPLAHQLAVDPIISKNQLFRPLNPNFMNPALLGRLRFANAVTNSLTGANLTAGQAMTNMARLNSGLTRSQYVAEVWSGDAHLGRQANTLYQSLLGRAPTAAERASAIQSLRAGGGELGLSEQLLSSSEYQARHVGKGALAAALSSDILGRTPSTAAHRQLVQALDSQPINVVVRNMLQSSDGLALVVDSAYRTTLRRAATTAETQRWVALLQAGTTTPSQLAQSLLATEEFYQLAFNSAV